MVSALLAGAVLLAAAPESTTAAGPDDLAAYRAASAKVGRDPDAHVKLALWCEKKGLKAEETAHLTAVTRLDPSRDAAWKRLGCKPYNGRWMTDEQVAALKSDAERQKQADRHWRPLLEKWRDRLGDRAKRDS